MGLCFVLRFLLELFLIYLWGSRHEISEIIHVRNFKGNITISLSKCPFHVGIVHLFVSEELRIEGRLHANGEQGGNNNAGGGAGGSVYISTRHLDGTGSIEASGGDGTSCIIDTLKATSCWVFVIYHTIMVML